jgi:hypothetical protein
VSGIHLRPMPYFIRNLRVAEKDFELMDKIVRRRVYVQVIRVHEDGTRHWGYMEGGYRVVERRRGEDCVRWKGRWQTLHLHGVGGSEVIFLECSCGFGQIKPTTKY